MSYVGEVQGCVDPRHASPDHQGAGGHGHPEGGQVAGLGHRHRHQVLSLLGGLRRPVVTPAVELPDVGHLEQEGVDAPRLHALAESGLVHPWAAGCDDNPVEAVLRDVFPDHPLARVGAHVPVVLGDHHPRQISGRRHVWAVHDPRDVQPAVADVHADPHLFKRQSSSPHLGGS
jgi:hypothetical protein